jgi:hypothetical protein
MAPLSIERVTMSDPTEMSIFPVTITMVIPIAATAI